MDGAEQRRESGWEHGPHGVELVAVEARRRVARDQFPDLFLSVSLDDANAKGAGGIEHGPEDDHSSLLHDVSPKCAVLLHDGLLIIGHVQGEGGPDGVQFEEEVLFHRIILSRDEGGRDADSKAAAALS
jgi:hypothetical protein